MFENKLKIEIPEPCSQQWLKMKETETGRFCNKCNKNLINFTNFSDKELADFIQNNKTKVCGRFKKEQLNKFYFEKKLIFKFDYFKKIAATLLTFNFLYYNAEASHLNSLNRTYFVQKINDKKISVSKFIELPIFNDTIKKEIKGIIIDNTTKDPLIMANIFIKNTQIAVESDIDGAFTIKIPDSLDQQNLITIIVSYLGYMEQEIIINMVENQNNKVFIELHPYDDLLGEIIIIEKKWWQFWKWF